MKVNTERLAGENDRDIVVFLIGMRLNRWWKVHRWLPFFGSMPKMLRELQAAENSGLLHYEMWLSRTVMVVQYWDSIEKLLEYSTNKQQAHIPAWAAYSKKIGSGGDVGIWHETYRVKAGQYESIYHNMPSFGIGRALGVVEAKGQKANARRRLGVNPKGPSTA